MRRPDSLDDVDGILVYADALMTRGDPHGNLIALQQGKKSRQANAWLAKHAPAILGELAKSDVKLEWQSGFIRKASLTEWEDDAPTMVELYDQLRACPAAQLIVELQLDQAPMDVPSCTTERGYCYEPLFAHMVKHPVATLRTLRVGADVNKPEYNCMHGLARVLAKHPGLEKVTINGGVYDFGSPKLPKLRTLRILADHDAATIKKLARAHLPALDELDVHGGGTEEDPPTAADYAKLFAGERTPKLRRLVFSSHADGFVDVVRELLRSPLLRRLDELMVEFIDNEIADLVSEDPLPLRHLKKVALTTLEPRDVTPSRRKRLKAALPKLKMTR